MSVNPFFDELRLSDEDRRPRVWMLVRSHCERRLSELRAQLEGDATWEETVAIRKQIREIIRLLELEVPIESQYPAMDAL